LLHLYHRVRNYIEVKFHCGLILIIKRSSKMQRIDNGKIKVRHTLNIGEVTNQVSSILKLSDLGTFGLAYLDRTRDSEKREAKPRERERTDRNVRSDVYRTSTKQCRNWTGCVSVCRNCWHVHRECLFSYKRRNFIDPRSPRRAS